MSVTRKAPNTDAGRALALDRAALKRSTSLPADVVLSAPTQTRLSTVRAALNQNLALRGQALVNQGNMTPDKDAKNRTAALYISHFIQCQDKAALRGEPGFLKADRGHFQLDITNDTLPPLVYDNDVFLWGQRIIDGDVLRLAAGKPAIPFPVIADVSAKYNLFSTVFGAYNLLKRAYDDAQEAISNMRADVDSLILRIWNETEAAYSEEDAASKRRNAREWGVVYVLVAGAAPSPDDFSMMGTVRDSITNQPIDNAAVVVSAAAEIIVLTDGNGKYLVPVLPAGTYDYAVHKGGYTQNEGSVTVTAGAIVTRDIQLVPTASASTGTVQGVVTVAGAGVAANIIVEGTTISTASGAGTGNYNLPGVPVGEQIIRATSIADPSKTQAKTATITEGGTVTLNFSFP